VLGPAVQLRRVQAPRNLHAFLLAGATRERAMIQRRIEQAKEADLIRGKATVEVQVPVASSERDRMTEPPHGVGQAHALAKPLAQRSTRHGLRSPTIGTGRPVITAPMSGALPEKPSVT